MMRWLIVGWALGCVVDDERNPEPLEPTRSSTVAVLPDGRVVVADEDEGQVWLVDNGDVTAQELQGVPSRVATWEDRAWVTLRASGEVAELQVVDGAVQLHRTVSVGPEPVGIVVHPDGSRIYVGVTSDAQVVELDRATLEVTRRFDLGTPMQWLAMHPEGILYGVSPGHAHISWLDVDARAPQQRRQSLLPFGGQGRRGTGDPAISPRGDEIVVPVLEMVAPVAAVQYYAESSGTPGAVNPSLQVFDLDPTTGEPGAVPTTTSLPGNAYVTSVVWRDDDMVLGTQLGTERVVAWEMSPGDVVGRQVGRGPSGLARSPDGSVWVHVAHDLLLRRFAPDATWLPPVSLGESRLSPLVREGRHLFHSTIDQRITTGGISCASCHVEGRSDNHTWELDTGAWQTPSLAGGIASTAPFSWAQDVPTVAEEARLTAQERMGGLAIAPYETFEAVAAYIETLRLPMTRTPTAEPDVLALGREAFAKAECNTCHIPPLYTDNQSYALFGVQRVQTPSLRGLASSSPYLHDGRARALPGLLRLSEDGDRMGRLDRLDEEEWDALLHFLRSL